MIAVFGRFCSPEGIYIGYCGSYGSFSAWVWSFLGPGKDGGIIMVPVGTMVPFRS